jgi:hypothetical protein
MATREDIEFVSVVWCAEGPGAWCFVTLPAEDGETLHAVARVVSRGWGMVPVRVHVGDHTWTTSAFPHHGTYAVPVRAAVRRALGIAVGDVVRVRLDVASHSRG